jgi:hypothetical protein
MDLPNLKPQEGAQTTFFNLSDDIPLAYYGGSAGVLDNPNISLLQQ